MNVKHILWIIVGILLMYPLTGVIESLPFTDIKPYTKYREFMEPIWEYIFANFSWIVIAFISFIIIKIMPEIMYKYQEKIRLNQYINERDRWSHTPYIAPLMLYYMLCPPIAFSKKLDKQAYNEFYPLVVNDFQNRVSINAKFTSHVPLKRKSAIRVVGPTIIAMMLLNYLAFAFVLHSIITNFRTFDSFVNSDAKFLIPIVLYTSGYATAILFAIVKTAPWSLLDKKLKQYFEEYAQEPRIAWVDIMPDTDIGYGIIKMWERDAYRRIQLTYKLSGKSLPHNPNNIVWNNPTIPGNPFPETLDFSWVPNAREYIYAARDEWNANHERKIGDAKKGKFIDINQMRLKK